MLSILKPADGMTHSGTNQLAEAYDTNWGNIPDCFALTLWRTSVSPGRSEAGGRMQWFV